MAEAEWIDLFNGTDLSGWTLRKGGPNGWSVEPDGVYRSEKPSADLLTEREFEDFELHVEFNMPPKSNSGVYLRGIFEIQVINHREEMTWQACGALYKRPKAEFKTNQQVRRKTACPRIKYKSRVSKRPIRFTCVRCKPPTSRQ